MALGGQSAGTASRWLLLTRDPHIMEKLAPYLSEPREKGRIFTTGLKVEPSQLPLELQKVIEPLGLRKILEFYPARGNRQTALRPDPAIVRVLNTVNLDEIRNTIHELGLVRDRSKGTIDNLAMTNWVSNRLKTFGYETSLQCFDGAACNVIAERRGNTQPDEVVIVEGHLDSVGHPFAGADDNASGVAGVLEMARVVSAMTPDRTVRFLVTNAEEVGLVGSEYYVKSLGNEIYKVKFAINMDMIAYNADGILDIETNAEFEMHAKHYSEMALLYTLLQPHITMPAWGSDHVPFLEMGVPTILTIEHWDTKTPCYHLECDKEDTLNLNFAGEIIRLNTAMLLEVALYKPSRF